MSERSFICSSPSLALPPEHPPALRSMEKLPSMKPVPGAKQVGDRCISLSRRTAWPGSVPSLGDTHSLDAGCLGLLFRDPQEALAESEATLLKVPLEVLRKGEKFGQPSGTRVAK